MDFLIPYFPNFDWFNTLRPIRKDQHFANDIFKRIFFNENGWISIKISLMFVPKGQINNIPALVPIMAWRRSGNKPLSEPMMISLPTHICVNRPQWVKLMLWARWFRLLIHALRNGTNPIAKPVGVWIKCRKFKGSMLKCFDLKDKFSTC